MRCFAYTLLLVAFVLPLANAEDAVFRCVAPSKGLVIEQEQSEQYNMRLAMLVDSEPVDRKKIQKNQIKFHWTVEETDGFWIERASVRCKFATIVELGRDLEKQLRVRKSEPPVGGNTYLLKDEAFTRADGLALSDAESTPLVGNYNFLMMAFKLTEALDGMTLAEGKHAVVPGEENKKRPNPQTFRLEKFIDDEGLHCAVIIFDSKEPTKNEDAMPRIVITVDCKTGWIRKLEFPIKMHLNEDELDLKKDDVTANADIKLQISTTFRYRLPDQKKD